MSDSLDSVLMRHLLNADNSWDALAELEAKVAGYRDWMTRLAKHNQSLADDMPAQEDMAEFEEFQ